MNKFFFITLFLIVIGIVLILVPRKWYSSSKLDLRNIGIWLFGLTWGVQLAGGTIYLLYMFFKLSVFMANGGI